MTSTRSPAAGSAAATSAKRGGGPAPGGVRRARVHEDRAPGDRLGGGAVDVEVVGVGGEAVRGEQPAPAHALVLVVAPRRRARHAYASSRPGEVSRSSAVLCGPRPCRLTAQAAPCSRASSGASAAVSTTSSTAPVSSASGASPAGAASTTRSGQAPSHGPQRRDRGEQVAEPERAQDQESGYGQDPSQADGDDELLDLAARRAG